MNEMYSLTDLYSTGNDEVFALVCGARMSASQGTCEQLIPGELRGTKANSEIISQYFSYHT